MSSEFYLQTKIKINEMDKSMVPFKIFSYSITNRYTLHETRYTYVHYIFTCTPMYMYTFSPKVRQMGGALDHPGRKSHVHFKQEVLIHRWKY